MNQVGLRFRLKKLPVLSQIDLRSAYYSDTNVTSVVNYIPFNFDLLSNQGKQNWEKRRRAFSSISNVETIRKKNSLDEMQADFLQRNYNFRAVDEVELKMQEIERLAEEMNRDFDEIGIPRSRSKQ